MLLEAPNIKVKPNINWEPLPDNFILPDDPVENIQQPPLAATLLMPWEPQDISSQKC